MRACDAHPRCTHAGIHRVRIRLPHWRDNEVLFACADHVRALTADGIVVDPPALPAPAPRLSVVANPPSTDVELIRLYVRDHPGVTAAQVRAGTGLEFASAHLSALRQRGRLEARGRRPATYWPVSVEVAA